jgi:hypothetical protein
VSFSPGQLKREIEEASPTLRAASISHSKYGLRSPSPSTGSSAQPPERRGGPRLGSPRVPLAWMMRLPRRGDARRTACSQSWRLHRRSPSVCFAPSSITQLRRGFRKGASLRRAVFASSDCGGGPSLGQRAASLLLPRSAGLNSTNGEDGLDVCRGGSCQVRHLVDAGVRRVIDGEVLCGPFRVHGSERFTRNLGATHGRSLRARLTLPVEAEHIVRQVDDVDLVKTTATGFTRLCCGSPRRSHLLGGRRRSE